MTQINISKQRQHMAGQMLGNFAKSSQVKGMQINDGQISGSQTKGSRVQQTNVSGSDNALQNGTPSGKSRRAGNTESFDDALKNAKRDAEPGGEDVSTGAVYGVLLINPIDAKAVAISAEADNVGTVVEAVGVDEVASVEEIMDTGAVMGIGEIDGVYEAGGIIETDGVFDTNGIINTTDVFETTGVDEITGTEEPRGVYGNTAADVQAESITDEPVTRDEYAARVDIDILEETQGQESGQPQRAAVARMPAPVYNGEPSYDEPISRETVSEEIPDLARLAGIHNKRNEPVAPAPASESDDEGAVVRESGLSGLIKRATGQGAKSVEKDPYLLQNVNNGDTDDMAKQLSAGVASPVKFADTDVENIESEPAVSTADTGTDIGVGAADNDNDDASLNGQNLTRFVQGYTFPESGQETTPDAAVNPDFTVPVRDTGIFTSIVERMTTAYQSGKSTFEIQLKPEFLGRMAISLSMEENGLTARIRTSNSETRGMISEQLVALETSLRDRGIEVVHMDVVYTELPKDFGGDTARQEWRGEQKRSVRVTAEPTAAGAYFSETGQIGDENSIDFIA